MGTLDGRIVLVTGAGRGIGREHALLLAAEGATVVVNDPGVGPDGAGGDAAVVDHVVDEIVAAGGVAVADTESVTDWNGARRMVQHALDAFGDLHIVVNNATIKADKPLTRLTEAEFDDVVAVKLKGSFAISHWAARHWRERHDAGITIDRSIVNTASGSGLVNPLPNQTNYAAANAGVAAMTVVHALELGRYGVRVNCVSPSMVRTRLTPDVPGMREIPEEGAFDPLHPMNNSPVVGYLATENCPVTGQVLAIRGSNVAVNHGWSRGPEVGNGNQPWTVDTLATALDALEFEDQFDKLSAALGGALGNAGRDRLQQMISALVES